MYGGKLWAGVVTLLLLFLAGCSTIESRIQSNPQVYGLLTPADQSLVRQGGIREGLSKAAVYLAWGSPDRIRSGVQSGRTFEAWTYTTLRSQFAPNYYYYPGYDGFAFSRGGLWRGNHFFYSFGPYPYSFYRFPEIVSAEIPYKTAFFEGGRCTGWEYLRY